jgi:hypothetical protein
MSTSPVTQIRLSSLDVNVDADGPRIRDERLLVDLTDGTVSVWVDPSMQPRQCRTGQAVVVELPVGTRRSDLLKAIERVALVVEGDFLDEMALAADLDEELSSLADLDDLDDLDADADADLAAHWQLSL